MKSIPGKNLKAPVDEQSSVASFLRLFSGQTERTAVYTNNYVTLVGVGGGGGGGLIVMV